MPGKIIVGCELTYDFIPLVPRLAWFLTNGSLLWYSLFSIRPGVLAKSGSNGIFPYSYSFEDFWFIAITVVASAFILRAITEELWHMLRGWIFDVWWHFHDLFSEIFVTDPTCVMFIRMAFKRWFGEESVNSIWNIIENGTFILYIGYASHIWYNSSILIDKLFSAFFYFVWFIFIN